MVIPDSQKSEEASSRNFSKYDSTIEKTKELIQDFIASSTLGFYYFLLFAI